MFALRLKKTGELMGFYASSNGDAEFATDVVYRLTPNSFNNVWIVKNRNLAVEANKNSAEYYNADYETPHNDYVGECEVVELEIK